MTDDFDVDDVAAIRAQGDLRAFMRSRMRRTATTPPKEPEWKPPPGHIPGAWPPGTRPVDRGDPLTNWTPEWTAALEDYRLHPHDEDDEEQQ